jgi:polygalacturonase
MYTHKTIDLPRQAQVNCRRVEENAVSAGSVGSGCVENVLYRNITMTGQENGCRVKTYSDKAGRVRNITWDDIVIKKTGDCVTVNANYKPTPPHPTNFIDVQDLTFRNIVGTVRHDIFGAIS